MADVKSLKLNPKFTLIEKAKYLICQPWLARLVVMLPIPKKWKRKFVFWQIMTLANIALASIKRCLDKANKETQEGAVVADVRLTDTASIKTSSKWETSNDHGDGNGLRITARTRSVEEGSGDTRQD